MRKPPEHAEVLTRKICLPDGKVVQVYIDLSPAALQRFAAFAAENDGQSSCLCDGTFMAVVQTPNVVQMLKII